MRRNAGRQRPHLTLEQRAAGHRAVRRTAGSRPDAYRAAISAGSSAATGTSRRTGTSVRDVLTATSTASGSRCGLRGLRPRPRFLERPCASATQRVRVRRRDRAAAGRCGRSASSRPNVRDIERVCELIAGRQRRATTGARASSPASSTPRAHCSRAVLRIAQHRPRAPRTGRSRVLRVPRLRLRHRGRRTGRTGCAYVRIRGGLHERLRFFHLTDPAITRKRTIDGARAQVRRRAPRRVDRAARASSSRCTTSRPARATSSPTAS